MKRPTGIVALAVAGLMLVTAGVSLWRGDGGLGGLGRPESDTVTSTDYQPPRAPAADVLVDDRLVDKHTQFDPGLVNPISPYL